MCEGMEGGLPMEYAVRFTWDADTGVWIAESEDIPGLVLECGSLDALMERVRFAVPELLELNHMEVCESICFYVERHERMPA